MSESPTWLPECVSTDGEWDHVLGRLYGVFRQDFVVGKPRFMSREVWWERRVEQGDRYEEGFWHLVTRIDRERGERLLDPRRAERLPWCAPAITNANDNSVTVWDYREAKGNIRTYLWLQNGDYVVVLEKKTIRRGEIAFLVTAFYVDGPGRRRALEHKHKKRLA